MKFEIDDNVQMARKGRSAKWQSFPFATLEVGQSFHIKASDLQRDHNSVSNGAKAMSILAIQASKRLERKFAVRTVTDDPRGAGVRIWRQADPSKSEGLDSLFAEEGEKDATETSATVAAEPRAIPTRKRSKAKKDEAAEAPKPRTGSRRARSQAAANQMAA